MHQNTRSLQMESMSKRARRPTRIWSVLLGHLRSSGDLAKCPVPPDPLHTTRVAQPSIGFCHGVCASTSRDAPLPMIATRIQTKKYDQKIPRAQAQTQSLLAEASRKSVEPIHGPGYEGNWFYPEQVRPMLVLPQFYHLIGIHQ